MFIIICTKVKEMDINIHTQEGNFEVISFSLIMNLFAKKWNFLTICIYNLTITLLHYSCSLYYLCILLGIMHSIELTFVTNMKIATTKEIPTCKRTLTNYNKINFQPKSNHMLKI